MDCEPLHDIKGHLLNLFAELPSILENPVQAACINRIKQCQLKEKKSAADPRSAVIQILQAAQDVDWKVTCLLKSIIKISEVMYSTEQHRSPRLLLQLYNNVWLHHQLCYELFQTPQSREALFGLYLTPLADMNSMN